MPRGRPLTRRESLALLGVAGISGLAGCTGGQDRDDRSVYYVGPDGAYGNPGSEDQPLDRIQLAIERAHPGDTVEVLPGEYQEELETVRSGEPDAPISITGPTDAVVRAPQGTSDLIRVEHSHVHLEGLTLTGLADPEAADAVDSYAGNITEMTPPTDSDEYLRDLVFRPDRIGHVRRALVSLIRCREVDIGTFQVIGGAGARSYVGDVEGHNAEVVYVGTAPANLSQDWYPWDEPDFSRDVRVHHVDASRGVAHTELVDVKLGSHDVTVEYCTSVGARLPTDNDNGSAVHIGGTDVTFRWNRIEDAAHHAIDVGNYGPYNEHVPHPDAPDAGRENRIYGNELVGSGALAINFTEEIDPDDQRVVCGNVVDTETEGRPATSCPSDVPSGDGVGHLGGDSPWS